MDRFPKPGTPFPTIPANFAGGLEILVALLLTGPATKLILRPSIFERIVAILTTKVSLYLGTSPPSPLKIGSRAVPRDVRCEDAQRLATIFLLAKGPGGWSLDAMPAASAA